jgi:hypothetical protein
MTEMVLQFGVDRVGWQLKSLFQARQGVFQEETAENSLLVMFRMDWGMHYREPGKKVGFLCPRRRAGQVIFQINIL